MIEALLAYFEARMALTDEQRAFIRSVAIPRKLAKGEFVQRAGDEPRYGIFVVRGCLRSYVIDDKGKEHILQFAPETWWVADSQSAANGEPSRLFFEAIEDSEVLLIAREAHQRMVETIPGFAAAYANGLLRMHAARERRLVESLSATAEQRYLQILEIYPRSRSASPSTCWRRTSALPPRR
jgi:CRP-like cAMP-binding protein